MDTLFYVITSIYFWRSNRHLDAHLCSKLNYVYITNEARYICVIKMLWRLKRWRNILYLEFISSFHIRLMKIIGKIFIVWFLFIIKKNPQRNIREAQHKHILYIKLKAFIWLMKLSNRKYHQWLIQVGILYWKKEVLSLLISEA